MKTETGGTVLFVQYPGPTTGGRLIYGWPHEPQVGAGARDAGPRALSCFV